MPNKGKLSIVGAGPGDPELITLKAIKAIEAADVVLYDALINTDLLNYSTNGAEQIFVGKRRGCYAFQQEQINELIVERAKQGKHVIRLKGGDPFVFGRGAEEIEYAATHGIDAEIIPGITSAIAVPAYNNIPVTKRKVSESFWVITGTTKDHKLSNDVELALQSSATIIILMGMKKLPEIVKLFQKHQKGNKPIAIIQEGTTKEEKQVVGKIDTIVNQVEEHGVKNPAIIIIGDVVKNREQLKLAKRKASTKSKANELTR